MRIIPTALIVAVFWSSGAFGSSSCNKQDFEKSRQIGFSFSNWTELHKSYQLFGQCDDGGETSESYSESVARLLVDHWEAIEQLVTISRKDSDFKKFVLRHVDATVVDDDLYKIARLSSEQCPAAAWSLCAEIDSQVHAAIDEYNNVSLERK